MQNLFPSIGFSVCGLMFTIVLSLIYISKKKYENVENKLYRIILSTTYFILGLEITFAFTIYYRDRMPLINEFVCRIYIIFCWLWLLNTLIYMYIILKKKKYNSLYEVYKEPFFFVMLIMMIICSIVSFFFKFTFGGDGGQYLSPGGPAEYPLYIASVFFICYFSYLIIKNRNEVKISKVLPLFILIFYFMFNYITQKYYELFAKM